MLNVSKFNLRPKVLANDSLSLFADLLFLKRSVVLIFVKVQIDSIFIQIEANRCTIFLAFIARSLLSQYLAQSVSARS